MDEFVGLTREELVAIILDQVGAIEQLSVMLGSLSERVAYLEKENESLRSQLPRGGDGGAAVPPFVKLNKKARPDEDRKKRKKWFVRRREKATEEIAHPVGERCPDCDGPLSKAWEHDRRQVIEIPISPIRVIDHVIMAQRCGYCGKVHHSKLTAADGVIGKHRFGIRFMSTVATLSTVNRIPHRMIQKVLEGFYGVHVSVGEISQILHKVAQFGDGDKQRILEEIRGSPATYNDETGWRENGVNGYLWSVSTDSARYYHRDKSRSQEVSKKILGESFDGVLAADFYGGYNWYCGPIQRCWAHFKRDLDELAEKHPDDSGVKRFVKSTLRVYRRGKKIAKDLERRKGGESERFALASILEDELLEIARPFLDDKGAAQHTLSKRIERHEGEFFTFVRYEGVSATNNAAERAIRPAVTARKISGGTRSPKGSETKSTLMTLFGTWMLSKPDPIQACAQMLVDASLAPIPSSA